MPPQELDLKEDSLKPCKSKEILRILFPDLKNQPDAVVHIVENVLNSSLQCLDVLALLCEKAEKKAV